MASSCFAFIAMCRTQWNPIYDVKYVDFNAERARDWDDTELWDASYAEILFDPEGLLER